MSETTEASLVMSRMIRATPARVFEAWTTPQQLLSWWGPKEVTCNLAEIDLRVGGRYRLGNELPNGEVLVITGTFTEVDPPRVLAFTWGMEPSASDRERVRVEIEPHEDGAMVTVVHRRIANDATKRDHEHGWQGCLDGLGQLLEGSPS